MVGTNKDDVISGESFWFYVLEEFEASVFNEIVVRGNNSDGLGIKKI